MRVYDPDVRENDFAGIAVYSMSDDKLIALTTIPLAPPRPRPANPQARIVPPFAGYGQVADLRNAFVLPQGTTFPTGRVRAST